VRRNLSTVGPESPPRSSVGIVDDHRGFNWVATNFEFDAYDVLWSTLISKVRWWPWLAPSDTCKKTNVASFGSGHRCVIRRYFRLISVGLLSQDSIEALVARRVFCPPRAGLLRIQLTLSEGPSLKDLQQRYHTNIILLFTKVGILYCRWH
jgi:hypothetical protein